MLDGLSRKDERVIRDWLSRLPAADLSGSGA